MISSAGLKYKRTRTIHQVLGEGAYSMVYVAIEEGSGRRVALKKSRVPKKVKRPGLQHEARVLQLLRGPAAIPIVYGYGHLEHFECLAMEVLGPSLGEQQKKGGAGVMAKTVIRILDQALAALQHIHSLGILHRDIKPENILCALNDEPTIKIIDFNIAKPISHGPPSKYHPLKEHRQIVGSLYWASLNSHSGEELAPRDDIESLSYIALFLLRGNLPWKPRPRLEDQVRSQEVVRLMKSACSGPALSTGIPNEFGELLNYSRSLKFDRFPEHGEIRRSFANLAQRMGYPIDSGPFDWTPCYPKTTNPILAETEVLIPDNVDDDDDDDDDDESFGDNSYLQNLEFEHQGNRDNDVTLPAERETELDSIIPLIEEAGFIC